MGRSSGCLGPGDLLQQALMSVPPGSTIIRWQGRPDALE